MTLRVLDFADGFTSASAPVASFLQPVESKSALFTPEYGTLYITTGSFSIQLPALLSGLPIRIKKSDDGIITVLRNASEMIDGISSSYTINSEKQSIDLDNDGTNWFLT